MEKNRAFFMGLVLLLLAVDCSLLDLKVNVMVKANSEDPKTNEKKGATEQISVSNSNSNSNTVSGSNTAEKEQKKTSQVTKSKENIHDNVDGKETNGSDNNEDKNGSKKPDNVEKENTKSEEKKKPEAESDDNEKKNIMPKEKSKERDSEASVKDSHVEDCDPSNKCTDDENKFFACLRVPGNDLQYSLLVQNKAKKPLIVAISAPDFVKLEKTEIQLQPEANQKVEVSITKGGSENLIVLKSGNGHCKLDIKHLLHENSDNLVNSEKANYVNFMSRTRTIIVLSLAALLVLGAGWAFISFRKKQLLASGAKYRRLDPDLPVSGGVKPELENNEGWDNSWGDDWDDEEAPKTPSMPLTPSLSSKGLASRRLIKEAWKD